MKPKKPVKVSKEQKMLEKVMVSFEDSISYGVYCFLSDMNREIRLREKRRKRCKRIINRHTIQKENRPVDTLPGIATCEHGIYECPECAKKRRRGQHARKNLPKP